MPFFRIAVILGDQIGYCREARRYRRMLEIQTGFGIFLRIRTSNITKTGQETFQLDCNCIPCLQEMKINIQQTLYAKS